MKFIRSFVPCHKTLGLSSHKILVIFVYSTDFSVSQPNFTRWKMPLTLSTLINLRTMPQQWLKLYRKCRKESFRKTDGTLKSHYLWRKQLTLYMHTCLSHVLGNLQNKVTVYVFTQNKLCLFPNILCSTAHKFPLRSMAMQKTGTVLDIGKKSTNHRVSTGWSCYKQCQDFTRTM